MFGIYWQEVNHIMTCVILEGEEILKYVLEKKVPAEGWVTAAAPCHHGLFSLCPSTPGGVIAYISSSSSGSSPESCHSDSSNGSYQSSSPPHGSSPSRHQQGQPADPALPAGCQNLPGTQKNGRSSSTAKCGITSKPLAPHVWFDEASSANLVGELLGLVSFGSAHQQSIDR